MNTDGGFSANCRASLGGSGAAFGSAVRRRKAPARGALSDELGAELEDTQEQLEGKRVELQDARTNRTVCAASRKDGTVIYGTGAEAGDDDRARAEAALERATSEVRRLEAAHLPFHDLPRPPTVSHNFPLSPSSYAICS